MNWNSKTVFLNLWVLCSLVCCFQVCKTPKNYTENYPIVFNSGSCYVKCPEYRVTLPLNAPMVFEGFKNVPLLGKHQIELPTSKLEDIQSEFFKLNLKKIKKTYNSNLRDIPTKMLIHHTDTIRIKGNKDVPKELLAVIQHIEKVVNTYVFDQ